MKKTVKILLPAFLAICLCASLISGATFALFTSQSDVNITVSSGKVDVQASVASLQYAADTTEKFETWTDATVEGDALVGEYPDVGGTIRFEGNTLALTEFIPGDAVKFELAITNNSTVSVKYRVRLIADDSVLAQYLKVTVDGEEVTLDGTTALKDWAVLTVGSDPVNVTVQIVLPAAVTHEQVAGGSECSLKINVLAIQGNGPSDAPCDETGKHTLGADGVCLFCGKKVVEAAPSTLEDLADTLSSLQDPNVEAHVEFSQDMIGTYGEFDIVGAAVIDFGDYQCRATSSSNGATLTARDGGSLTVNASNPGATSSDYTAGMLKAINGGQITINGEGKFKGGNPTAEPSTYRAAINADNGSITINGGRFYCESYQSTMVKAFNNGIVTIAGGTISGDNGGYMFVADGGTIQMSAGKLDLADNAAVWFTASNGGHIILGSGVNMSRHNAGTPQYFSVTGEGSSIVVYKDITCVGSLESFVYSGDGSSYHVEDCGEYWEITALA